jgi:hypothetical protein
MSFCKPASSTRSSSHLAARPSAVRSGWQLCVALFAALSFVLLISTAATHRHTSALSAHDCALCSAVADKIADTPAPPAVVLVLQLQPYLLVSLAAYVATYVSPKLLPPSCGPPHASA